MIIEKPLITVSGRKSLFKSNLHERLMQDLPQEGVEWRRRLDKNSKSVYIDVDFVDFDVDSVERVSERCSRLRLAGNGNISAQNNITVSTGGLNVDNSDSKDNFASNDEIDSNSMPANAENDIKQDNSNISEPDLNHDVKFGLSANYNNDVSHAFFNQKLLGRPILHTYWADKTDFEGDSQKLQFDEWIGQVQGSSCTEWAIIIIEDGDFKGQLGTALFKSKLQSSASQANASSNSISSLAQTTSTSFLDRMKKGLSTMFQGDQGSERWLTLINQDRSPDNNKVQESYANFVKKFRNLIMASFSKQIELFEEQLRVQREMRTDKNWNFFSYFSMQEELAFAFEFITLFDEALVQYDLLDALFTDYMSSPGFNERDEPLYSQWTTFKQWQGLCLDLNSDHSMELRRRIVDKEASLLDLRNYLFAKQCDLMLMQNEPWRVAASATIFLQNCLREHELLNINLIPGALACWCFISALEVLQKCECYSCTSTMENYSLHTVDLWNCARKSLLKLGSLTHRMPGMEFEESHLKLIDKLVAGLGRDPHGGVSYQSNDISPQVRLRDALASNTQFSKHLIEISELTLGTYKHIGRKRHALLIGKELADFYIAQNNPLRALPFLTEFEKALANERWVPILDNLRDSIEKCNTELGSSSDRDKSEA